MNYSRRLTIAVLAIWALAGLGGCASMPESVVSQPKVKLRDVEVVGLGFNAQTFLLTFDVSNPNPFSLPVNRIKLWAETRRTAVCERQKRLATFQYRPEGTRSLRSAWNSTFCRPRQTY